MLTPLRLLMVEDSEDDALLMIRTLRKNGFEPSAERVQTSQDMIRALLSQTWDIILCDYHLPGFSGIEAMALLKKTNLDIPLIIVSGAIDEETALDCIYQGASDYLLKDNLTRLGLAVVRELEKKNLRARQQQEEEEHRKLERKLLTVQKMEAMGELAGGIAHDFNNILSGIMGYAELALTEKEESIRSGNIQQILHAAERARNLVKQILSFSRPAEQNKKPIDVEAVLQEALKLLQATIPANIEIRRKLTAGPVIIFADYTQIHQVVMNICTNAAFAMGEKGGILEVSLGREYLSVQKALEAGLKSAEYVKLSISDTGPGIDPALIDRIFDPFFTTKKKGEGTGLGLSVVYGIVKNHEGKVQVKSMPGQGATFHIYLPCLEKQVAAPPTHPVPHQFPGGSEHILFVDDEKALVDLMHTILTDLGYHVTACADSREALEIYQADPGHFDLIISDTTMPHLSGSELAQKIMELRPRQPIILCTGYSSYMNAEKATQLGIKTLLFKPFARRELAWAVRKALDENTSNTVHQT